MVDEAFHFPLEPPRAVWLIVLGSAKTAGMAAYTDQQRLSSRRHNASMLCANYLGSRSQTRQAIRQNFN